MLICCGNEKTRDRLGATQNGTLLYFFTLLLFCTRTSVFLSSLTSLYEGMQKTHISKLPSD